MLIEFSVENFMSIKDKVTLSMLAGKAKEHTDNMKSIGDNENILNTVAIYGANASGKSNLFKALATSIMLVRRSNTMQITQKLPGIIPFKFDAESIKAPSKFEFIFTNNGTKYIYGFSADSDKIYEEYLYSYLSAKPSKIFERKNTNNYEYTLSEEKELSSIDKRNTENKLLLATATEWNYSKTKDAYLWFAERIDTIDNYGNLINISLDKYNKDSSGDLKKFTLSFLKEAEINISDYNINKENLQKEEIMGNPVFAEMLKNRTDAFVGTKTAVITNHAIKNEKGEYLVTPSLNIIEESEGTRNLFFLSPILKETLEKGKTIVIDEIDRSLHPLLVEYVIGLFHNKNINKNGAQLIFNTHDTNILNLDIFRRDQIYLTEKNYKTGATSLFSLDEFSVRKTENIKMGYLLGRYGAIPTIGNGSRLWK